MAQICSENDFSIDLSNITVLPVQFVYQDYEWIAYQLVWPCMILFGIVSNTSFMYTVVRTPSFHTSTFIYLINLSLTDLMTLNGIGITLVVSYSRSLVRSEHPIASKIVAFFISFTFLTSLCFVTLVSLERCLAICYPLKHYVLKGTRRTVKLICTTWLAGLALSMTTPSYFQYETICIIWPKNSIISEYASSQFTRERKQDNIYTLVISFVYIAFWGCLMTFNFFLYAKIHVALKRRKRNGVLHPSSSDTDDQLHRQVGMMLIVNGSVFFFCCAIQTVVQVIDTLDVFGVDIKTDDELGWIVWKTITNLMIGFNSSINPILYLITNKRYRSAFKTRVFGCSHVNNNIVQKGNTKDEIKVVSSL